MTSQEKKKLPAKIGSEKRIRIDYAVFKIMATKNGASTVQYPDPRDSNTWFTVKPIREEGQAPQVQWHVRFKAEDGRIFDVDAYSPLVHLKDLADLREEMRTLKYLPSLVSFDEFASQFHLKKRPKSLRKKRRKCR